MVRNIEQIKKRRAAPVLIPKVDIITCSKQPKRIIHGG
jgi:hypothetical protein